ncbi:hypothetical protein KIL84_022686 [Mauremys mutica]|uniref:Uncharacterized protein n=1 Tax=Mauremys mutica TaxID=74926 RepID=A0A9D3WNP2_9SAUR|nr:hypothetical protein KIL84_022686 [Mauremys mutica]
MFCQRSPQGLGLTLNLLHKNSTKVEPLYQCKFLHTTLSRKGLEEFFDDPKNWGETVVKSDFIYSHMNHGNKVQFQRVANTLVPEQKIQQEEILLLATCETFHQTQNRTTFEKTSKDEKLRKKETVPFTKEIPSPCCTITKLISSWKRDATYILGLNYVIVQHEREEYQENTFHYKARAVAAASQFMLKWAA